jgi:hypothetical protein
MKIVIGTDGTEYSLVKVARGHWARVKVQARFGFHVAIASGRFVVAVGNSRGSRFV